jgi:hypothetical protein
MYGLCCRYILSCKRQLMHKLPGGKLLEFGHRHDERMLGLLGWILLDKRQPKPRHVIGMHAVRSRNLFWSKCRLVHAVRSRKVFWTGRKLVLLLRCGHLFNKWRHKPGHDGRVYTVRCRSFLGSRRPELLFLCG